MERCKYPEVLLCDSCPEMNTCKLEYKVVSNYVLKAKFVQAFETSTKSKMVVAVQLPTGIEIIVNTDNVPEKMQYYQAAYNDCLELKTNLGIRIINYMFV